MDVEARWADVVGRPEREVRLDEAAVLIAAAADPSVDVRAVLDRIDALAGRVSEPGSAAVCRLLFGEVGLRGDRATYGDPRNSYLDQVLDRGMGIPISLSVLLVEVARRCGVRLEPVGMPGHFLVRDPAAGEMIDAFDGGRRLDREACEKILEAVAGDGAVLTPSMLTPTGTHAVLARMLVNLDHSFATREDRTGLGWVSALRAALPGTPLSDRTQLAGRLASLGRFDMAASVLETAATNLAALQGAAGMDPDVAAADGTGDALVAQATALRARLN